MRNFWLVAQHEVRTVVVRRDFLLSTLALPVGIAILIGLAIMAEGWNENRLPVGYVDQAGILSMTEPAPSSPTNQSNEIRAYPDQRAAQAGLERQEVQAVFVLPSDYLQTLKTDLYYQEKPPSQDAWRQFDDFVRQTLVRNLPDAVQQRLLYGVVVTVHDDSSGREFSEANVINIILPFVASFFFFFATMSAAGYLLRVVADEKENRTIELMLTSLTPLQLIGGKTLGLLVATLTQLLLYLLTAVVGLWVASPYVEMLQPAQVPWRYLGMMTLFFLPAYALIAAMMVMVGAAVTDLQQGQQIAGLLNLLFAAPFFLLMLLFENPSHPAVLLMSFFPTTSFLTLSLRWGLSSVPFWQMTLSWLILVGAALLMVWVEAGVFRIGMLNYGQPLTLKRVLRVVGSVVRS